MARLLQIAQLGDPVLRAQTAPVTDPYNPDLRTLTEDMLATLDETRGLGLAAPQVYESLQVFIFACRPTPSAPDAPVFEPTIALNPRITTQSEETETAWEGCMSIPGLWGLVPRSKEIAVEYQELTGTVVQRDLVGRLARVFQHEHDHLFGSVFLDRLASTRDLISEKEFLRLFPRR